MTWIKQKRKLMIKHNNHQLYKLLQKLVVCTDEQMGYSIYGTMDKLIQHVEDLKLKHWYWAPPHWIGRNDNFRKRRLSKFKDEYIHYEPCPDCGYDLEITTVVDKLHRQTRETNVDCACCDH